MTKPKAVLFAHVCYPGYMTGGEKLLLFLLRELSLRHDCTLVVPNEGMLAQTARSEGVFVIVHPFAPMHSLWKPSPSLEEEAILLDDRSLDALVNLLHMLRPDYVVAGSVVNAQPAAAAARGGIPVVWLVMEVLQDSPQAQQAAALVGRYADRIVAISARTAAPFRSAGFGTKTAVLYPSWHPGTFEPHMRPHYRARLRAGSGIPDDALVAGFVAADLMPSKGLDHFVAMALSLCGSLPQLHFLVAGNPTDAAYVDVCANMIAQSGYAARFAFVPFHSCVEAVYAACDIVVVPSMAEEGFGLTALEAMAIGKPVAAYRSGGLEELLAATGNEALLAERGQISGLVRAVRRLAEHDAYRLRVGESNGASARSQFGLAAYRERLGRLLADVRPLLAAARARYERHRASYADGALLKGDTPAVFLLSDGMKRAFADEAALAWHGFRWDQVQHVTDDVLQAYPTGRLIVAGQQ